jgi:hypothetical protein
MMSCDTVEMIKQFPKNVDCFSLSFPGGVVYIGSDGCIIEWTLGTDTVVKLEGYRGLIFIFLMQHIFPEPI